MKKICEVNMEELRKSELEMFALFLDICKKYNLKYFLLGGTCLGAVRHKAFIPWDDDIDVGLPRPDYEKFIDVAQKELPENIFLQNGKTDEAYPMNFSKLRNSNTCFIESSVRNFNINHGVYIDIFPLDGYEEKKSRDFANRIYNRRVATEYTFDVQPAFSSKMIDFCMKLAYPNYRKARDKRERMMKKVPYEQSELVYNWCGAWGKKELVPKEYFGNGTMGVFEGIEVRLPEKYDKYLTSLYGDYMQLPPVEKRCSHHYCEVVDLNKSYREYWKEDKK